ncbi:MAG: hypothetical protein HY560_08800 [Gemmatimonadetes bacterium]|nr:hypothetical protein [Gemmatimonadota bacterium]
MNRLTLFAVTLLSACVTSGHRVASLPGEPEPLDVAILSPSTGYAGFWVNQPAHLAMFDIGYGGVRMLYPRFEGERNRLVQGGSMVLSTIGTTQFASYFPHTMLDQARYLVVIASRAPLKITSVVGYRSDLQYRMRAAALGTSPLTMMNQLVDEVVPRQPDEDWATAVYVVYPRTDWRRGRGFYQLVYCADGNIYLVDLYTTAFFCPWGADTTKPMIAVPDSVRTRNRYTVDAARRGLLLNAAQSAELKGVYSRPSLVLERPPEIVRGQTYTWSSMRPGFSTDELRRQPSSGGNAGMGDGFVQSPSTGQGSYQPQSTSGSLPPLQPQTPSQPQGNREGSGATGSSAKGSGQP